MKYWTMLGVSLHTVNYRQTFWESKSDIKGILPKGPYPPCLRMADRALLAGYPQYVMKVWSCNRHPQRVYCMYSTFQTKWCVIPHNIFFCCFWHSIILYWNLMCEKISLRFVPWGPINTYCSIGSYNGLAPTRRQAIIRTNNVKFTDAYMCHSASMS